MKPVCRFWSDEDARAAVVQWFQQQPEDFSAEGIHQLVRRWDACRNAYGDYF
jgi:phage terminase large subunit-like protein